MTSQGGLPYRLGHAAPFGIALPAVQEFAGRLHLRLAGLRVGILSKTAQFWAGSQTSCLAPKLLIFSVSEKIRRVPPCHR